MITNPKGNHFQVNLPLFLPVLLLIFLWFSFFNAQAAVELVSFTATPGENSILIEWETATEYDNLGFYILRSIEETGNYNNINGSLILAKGDGPTGAEYDYPDTEVTFGVTYYYKLQAIGLDQQSEYYGPVSATLNLPTNTSTSTPSRTTTATRTRTPTATRTNTPTKTATGPTATASKTPTRTTTGISTRTLSPSRTPFPNYNSPTATKISIPSPTLSITSAITTTITTTTNLTNTNESMPTALFTVENDSIIPVVITPTFTPKTIPSITPDYLEQVVSGMVASGNFVRNSLVLLTITIWGLISSGLYLFLSKRNFKL